MKEASRQVWGDMLRVTAMVMVVAIHTYALTKYYLFLSNKTYFLLLSLFDSLTRAAVPVFFMLTGAFALKRYVEGKSEYSYRSTVVKLVIPFVIFSIIGYIYTAISRNEPLSLISFLNQFLSAGGTQDHMWFMYVIILIYLFMPFIIKLTRTLDRSSLKKLILLVIILGNVLYTINALLFPTPLNKIFSGVSLPSLVIYSNYLLIGYYLNTYALSSRLKCIVFVFGALSILALPLLQLIYSSPYDIDKLTNGTSVFSLFIALSMFMLFKQYFSTHSFNKNLLSIVTKISSLSFYVYMTHYTVLNIVRFFANQISLPDGPQWDILFLLGQLIFTTTISIVISFIFGTLYKPFINRLASR